MEGFTPALTRDIEMSVNQVIAENHEVKVYRLPRAEAMEIPDLIRTKINLLPPGIQEIRIVEIVGVDMQADGGTHVHETSEVGSCGFSRPRTKASRTSAWRSPSAIERGRDAAMNGRRRGGAGDRGGGNPPDHSWSRRVPRPFKAGSVKNRRQR